MRKYITAALVSIMTLAMLTGCGHKDIGKDKAAEAALEDAVLTRSDVTRLYVSQDRDDGVDIYEVQFTSEDMEYDYEIRASDGAILSVDMKELKKSESQNQQSSADQSNGGQDGADQSNGSQDGAGQNKDGRGSKGQSSSQADVQLSQEEAIQLALERVPGASERDLKIELDYDDGYYKYEGDIIYDQKEYEFEIDADTGAFLKWSEERR